jgi:hypothetical protein
VWRERWAAEAAHYGQSPLPETFDDPLDAGLGRDHGQERADDRALELARRLLELLRSAGGDRATSGSVPDEPQLSEQ